MPFTTTRTEQYREYLLAYYTHKIMAAITSFEVLLVGLLVLVVVLMLATCLQQQWPRLTRILFSLLLLSISKVMYRIHVDLSRPSAQAAVL